MKIFWTGLTPHANEHAWQPQEKNTTLTDYNERNNGPLLNKKIQEAVHKVMDKESILDTNNVPADTFSHTSNTQRDNANVVFRSEKLDKLDV